MLQNYFNRFDKTKEYDQVEFLAGRVLQSAELNDMQSIIIDKITNIGNSLFSDGAIISGAQVIIDPNTGATQCQSGAIYVKGAVRGVLPANFTIPTTGTIAIGVYVQQSDVTELTDPALRDPAALTRNYNQPGAGRLKLHVVWGRSGDSQTGDFYPVYSVVDGTLMPKEAPPSIDAITQAIASYDRDSAGSSYVVSGLAVTQLPDVSGDQIYSVAEGHARVNGYGVTLQTSRRLVYSATPDLRSIISEPHISSGTSSQLVTFNNGPADAITSIQITAQKTVSVVHGAYTGVIDALPDPTVLSVSNVSQGGTTYAAGTDYNLTGGNIDWSPLGAEPATGSTYSVTYRYIATVNPDSWNEDGFYVTGAVSGTQILVSYNQKLPRYDRLVIDSAGNLTWVKGIAVATGAQVPSVPSGMLGLATVYQNWGGTNTVSNDGLRLISMSNLSDIQNQVSDLTNLLSEVALQSNANFIDSSQKQGIFVDPLIDDSRRDAGLAQTAAVFDGIMTLPISISTVAKMPNDITARTSLQYTLSPVVAQPLVTGYSLVNPYMAFVPVPAGATITPSIDKWTQTNTTWTSSITRNLLNNVVVLHQGNGLRLTRTTFGTEIASSVTYEARFLRQISIAFSLTGFGPGEILSGVTFDGVSVTPTA